MLAPLTGLPLRQLVAMSQGQLQQSVVDDLVRQVNGGTIPEEAEQTMWQEAATPGRFAGQTVVVTAAGSGTGRAVASRVAREGGRVIAVDVSQPGIDQLVAGLPGTEIVTNGVRLANAIHLSSWTGRSRSKSSPSAGISSRSDRSPLAPSSKNVPTRSDT